MIGRESWNSVPGFAISSRPREVLSSTPQRPYRAVQVIIKEVPTEGEAIIFSSSVDREALPDCEYPY